MTVETKDILLKAAEDVQSGMWCKGGWLIDEDGHQHTSYPWHVDAEQLPHLRRCAEGSIGVAVSLLGGTQLDWSEACEQVVRLLSKCDCLPIGSANIPHFNDEHLPDDPFSAGQQLAELFRTTAESL